MASFGAPLGFNTKTQSRTQGTGLDDHRSYLTNKRTGVSDMAVLLRLPHVETQRRIKDDATRVVTSQSDRRNDNLLSPNQAQSSPQLQSSPSTLLEPFSFNPQSSSSTSPSSQTNPTTSNQSHVLKSHCKHQRNEGPRECETQRLQAMEPAQVRLQNLQASRKHSETIRDVDTTAGMSRDASPHSHWPNLTDSSNASASPSASFSASPSASTSISRELLAAQYDNAVQKIAVHHAPKPTHRCQSGKCGSPSPRARRFTRQNQQTARKSASHNTNMRFKLRGAASQAANIGGPTCRSRNSSPEDLSWQSWDEVQIKVSNIPQNTLTRDLASWFHGEGNIRSIEVFENPYGSGKGNALLIFR